MESMVIREIVRQMAGMATITVGFRDAISSKSCVIC